MFRRNISAIALRIIKRTWYQNKMSIKSVFSTTLSQNTYILSTLKTEIKDIKTNFFIVYKFHNVYTLYM